MLNRLYAWYGKRVVRGVAIALVGLIVIGFVIHKESTNSTSGTEMNSKIPEVTLRSVRNLRSVSDFSVVGTVRAVSEVALQAETSGRVTSVSVSIGDTVSAGTVLASIENSRERASLLQAEGAYESALAGAQKSDVSLNEAKVEVRNTYRDTFSTAENTVRNVIDQFYSNPGKPISGFRLSGTGRAMEFVTTRDSIENTLTLWSDELAKTSSNKTEEVMLGDAEAAITTISNLAADLALILSDKKDNIYLTDAERSTYSAQLAGARASLDGALSAISRTRNTYEQAKLSGTVGTVSQSSAQVKSALGMLRSAQAMYEKTLVRTPISGVVNVLSMREGEYVSFGQPVAIVANNGALEITTALGEKDIEAISISDTVFINNHATGTIIKIAPAVDPLTGKAEVRIHVDDALSLKNGSTANITFSRNVQKTLDEGKIIIPISALKLLPSGPIAFGVNADNVLVAYPVTLGSILGETVEISSGLTLESEIVTDARGLKEGEQVSVIQ